jgi:hypothetical protein
MICLGDEWKTTLKTKDDFEYTKHFYESNDTDVYAIYRKILDSLF